MKENRRVGGRRDDAEVLVLGAGIAGLAAARALANSGVSVLVLEAQDRIGGRIFTNRIAGQVVELGAEFVHGRPPQLIALLKEAGLELIERQGSHLRSVGGSLVADHAEQDIFAPLEQLKHLSGPDLSFAEFLDSPIVARQNISSEHRRSLIGYVEGFNAADHRIASAIALGIQQQAEEAIEGDLAFHVRGGYDLLTSYLGSQIEASGGQIRLDTRAATLNWSRGRVTVLTNQGSFLGSRVVIALPLGVLQSGAINFSPALPTTMRKLLSPEGAMRMGHVVRFTLLFRERFWASLSPQPSLRELSFLFTEDKLPPIWWTPHPEPSASLTGWIGGPRSGALRGLSADSLGQRACQILAEIFGLDPQHLSALLIGCVSHDWTADRNSHGAYSYVAKEGASASASLAEPIENTLYFGGEHTDTTGNWGTVHAALASGIRAASQVLSR